MNEMDRKNDLADTQQDLQPVLEEQVSNKETYEKLQKLAELVSLTLIRKTELGLANTFDLHELLDDPPEKIAEQLAGFIGRQFVFHEGGSGKHTIADVLDLEFEEVERQARIQLEIEAVLADESRFTPAELADKKRRDRQREIKDELRIVQKKVDEINGKHKVKQMFLGMRTLPALNKRMAALVEEYYKLEDAIKTPILPKAAHPIYEKEFDRLMGLQKERDCKVPTVICAQVLEYFRQTYGVPIQVRFATIRAMPHPFIEVSYGTDFSQKVFFDYSPRALVANKNKENIMRMLEIDREDLGTAQPIVRYHEVNEAGLAQLDRDFLMYKENNPQGP